MSGPDDEVTLRLTSEEAHALVVLLKDVALGSRILMVKSTTAPEVASAARGAAEGCERIAAKIQAQAKPAPKVLAEAVLCPACGGSGCHARHSTDDGCFDKCDGPGITYRRLQVPAPAPKVLAEAWGLRDGDGCDLRLWATEAEAGFAACEGHRVVCVHVVEVPS